LFENREIAGFLEDTCVAVKGKYIKKDGNDTTLIKFISVTLSIVLS